MVEHDQDDNRSFLVGVSGPETGVREAEALLDELQALVSTIGLQTGHSLNGQGVINIGNGAAIIT